MQLGFDSRRPDHLHQTSMKTFFIIILIASTAVLTILYPQALDKIKSLIPQDDKMAITQILKEDCEQTGYQLGLQDTSIEVKENLGLVDSAVCFPKEVTAGEGYAVYLKKSSGTWQILLKVSGPVPTITKTEKERLEKEGFPSKWLRPLVVE